MNIQACCNSEVSMNIQKADVTCQVAIETEENVDEWQQCHTRPNYAHKDTHMQTYTHHFCNHSMTVKNNTGCYVRQSSGWQYVINLWPFKKKKFSVQFQYKSLIKQTHVKTQQSHQIILELCQNALKSVIRILLFFCFITPIFLGRMLSWCPTNSIKAIRHK